MRRLQTLKETGIPTHDPLLVELDLQLCEQTGTTITTPLPLPLDWRDPVEDAEAFQVEDACQRILAEIKPAWEQAKADKNTTELYSIFSTAAESYIGHRAFGAPPPPRYTGRGKAVKTSQRQMSAPQQEPEEGAQDIAEIRLIELCRRVQELIRKITHRHVLAPLTQETFNLWGNCRQQGFDILPTWGAWQFPEIPDLASLQHLEALLREQTRTYKDSRQSARVQTWRARFHEDWRGCRRMAYEFARGASH